MPCVGERWQFSKCDWETFDILSNAKPHVNMCEVICTLIGQAGCEMSDQLTEQKQLQTNIWMAIVLGHQSATTVCFSLLVSVNFLLLFVFLFLLWGGREPPNFEAWLWKSAIDGKQTAHRLNDRSSHQELTDVGWRAGNVLARQINDTRPVVHARIPGYKRTSVPISHIASLLLLSSGWQMVTPYKSYFTRVNVMQSCMQPI